ncbi:MAG: recombinase family protein [Planctomycetes bacterium]|nr:recombinase family protein [Planctomycetota bacterium]
MIRDASGKTFQAIIVWDQDRFGRFDSIEAGHWIHPLRQAGVQLVTVSDGPIDWSDFSGRVIYTIKQEGKHQFLRDLSRNVLRGKLAAALRGDWLGKTPFGYVIENKRLILGDPAKVQLVRDVFAWYLAGDSVRRITRRLNEQGKTTPSGTLWDPSTIQRMLKRIAYTGTFKWNVQNQGKYHGIIDGEVSEAQSVSNLEKDWIVIPENHPAIIDQQDFDDVQVRLSARKRRTTPHQNGGKFVLTGLLRCGKCGGPMFGTIPRKGQAVQYVCSRDHSTGSCDRNATKQVELLQHVIDTVVDRFTDPDVVSRLRDELHRQVKSTTFKTNPEAIRRQMETVDTKLSKAKRRLVEVESDMVPIVSDHIRELTSKRDELQDSLQIAQTPTRTRLESIDARVDKAMGLFSQLRETLQRADTVHLRELLVRTIHKVEVWSTPVMRGRRRVFQLERGRIHLQSDQFDNLLRSS